MSAPERIAAGIFEVLLERLCAVNNDPTPENRARAEKADYEYRRALREWLTGKVLP